MNDYYNKVLDFENKLKEYSETIFRVYGKELVLRLEEYNLLQNKHNCIESSTATGFVLEEFLVSKLEMYTHCGDKSEYVIDRFEEATVRKSFDCFCTKDGVRFLVNIKAEKKGSSKNNGVAAISQLYKNYCIDNPEVEKAYVILKVKYSIKDAYEDSYNRKAVPRHIYIDSMDSFCLEELDFSKGHQQDHRSWSISSNNKNGRLLINAKYRGNNRLPEDKISYQNTFSMINDMYNDVPDK